MWTRADIKSCGRAAFLRNYGLCVLAALIIFVVSGGFSGGRSAADNASDSSNYSYEDENFFYQMEEKAEDAAWDITAKLGPIGWSFRKLAGAIGSTVGLVLAIAMSLGAVAVSIFIINPLEVGADRFFLVNLDTKARLGEFAFPFREGWLNITWVLFLREIKIFLWSLLFVVPGIVKAYEYRMVPYLLADDPYMPSEEAFRMSAQIMSGNKWDTFVLDLSFIGWELLSGLTGGLVGIFFTNPYKRSTDAALYNRLSGGEYTDYVDVSYREL